MKQNSRVNSYMSILEVWKVDEEAGPWYKVLHHRLQKGYLIYCILGLNIPLSITTYITVKASHFLA